MIHLLVTCSLGVVVLVGALWVVERNRLAGVPAETAGPTEAGGPGGPAADDLRGPVQAAPVAVPATPGPELQGDCLCVQCDLAPACPLTYPDCLRAASFGGGTRRAGPDE